MGRSKIFLLIMISFCVGIFLAYWFSYAPILYFWAIVLLLVVAVIFKADRLIFFAALSGIIITTGIFYANFFNAHFSADGLSRFQKRFTILEGYICQPPDVKAVRSNLTFCVEKIADKDRRYNVNGKILVYGDKYPALLFGQRLRIQGVLQEPPIFPDFNYKNYLARYQIFSVIFPQSVVQLKGEPQFGLIGNIIFKIKKVLYFVKDSFEAKINQILPEPQGALLDGLLLGVKRFLPANLIDDFSATGTTHIIVISGFNITIIIKAFMALTKRWSKKLAYFTAILAIFGFVVMTGAGPSVVRAGIMATILMWAEREGRRSEATIALIFAAVIMMLINPLILRFDIGFQLSFLATLGLIYFSPIMESWLAKSRLKKAPEILTEAGIATISAQVFVLPIILINFSRLSVIAPLANILILPIIPLTMLIGFIAVLAAFMFVPLGQGIAAVAWLLLSYIMVVVERLAALPGAAFNIERFNWIWFSAYYALLILGLSYYYLRQHKKLLKSIDTA